MKIHILTEGGTNIGFGHVSRCSALYDEMFKSGYQVNFVINGVAAELGLLENRDFQIENWMNEEYLNQNISKEDYVIIDSYLGDKPLYDLIAGLSKKALYIDDNCRIEYPKGIILNPALDVSHIDYSNSRECTVISGPDYIILREPFRSFNSKRTLKKDLKRVLITLGGSDTSELITLLIVNICNKNLHLDFDIVVGSKEIAQELERISHRDNIHFYNNLNANEIMALMLGTDLSITATGQTIHELIITKIPFIPILTSENQSNNASSLLEYGLVPDIYSTVDYELFVKLQVKLESAHIWKYKQITMMENIIDGNGCKRIIDTLTQNTLASNKQM